MDKNTIRERLTIYGCNTATDEELLGLFGSKVMSNNPPGSIIDNVAKKNIRELMLIYKLTKVQALNLKAAVEIGKRIFLPTNNQQLRLDSPAKAAQYLMPKIAFNQTEEFYVLSLNTKNILVGFNSIAKGSLSCAIVHPREVFNIAIINRAASILVAHNHPSGDPRPSEEDKELTKAVIGGGNILGIPVGDHIIVGQGKYFSFREHERSYF
jgi:DNA repair protein RadC